VGFHSSGEMRSLRKLLRLHFSHDYIKHARIPCRCEAVPLIGLNIILLDEYRRRRHLQVAQRCLLRVAIVGPERTLR
jgi:hypothetical protein